MMQPINLMLDTSTSKAVIALSVENTLYQTTIDSTKKQAEKLLFCIDSLISDAKIALKSIGYISVSKGPGSFTGLRVGVSAAQALAYALNIPVVSICSLQILAQQAHRFHKKDKVIVAIDARMQEVYWGEFSLQQGIMTLADEVRVSPPVELINRFNASEMLVGNAVSEYTILNQYFLQALQIEPLAEDLEFLSCAKYAQGKVISAGALVPEYIRNNVAKKSLKT